MRESERGVVIGLVDSGIAPNIRPRAAQSFRFDGARVTRGAAGQDRLGHATRMTALLQDALPDVGLVVAQVFFASLATTPEAVAAAIEWLAGTRVDLIHLSLGTPDDRPAIHDACRIAHEAGCLIVASAPTRGPVVFPAACGRVIRVCGDARCGPHDISHFGTDRIDFGACPQGLAGMQSELRAGGSSCAAARVTGRMARILAEGVPLRDVAATLANRCGIRGPQTEPRTAGRRR